MHGQTLFLLEIVHTKIEKLCEQKFMAFSENMFYNRILKNQVHGPTRVFEHDDVSNYVV